MKLSHFFAMRNAFQKEAQTYVAKSGLLKPSLFTKAEKLRLLVKDIYDSKDTKYVETRDALEAQLNALRSKLEVVGKWRFSTNAAQQQKALLNLINECLAMRTAWEEEKNAVVQLASKTKRDTYAEYGALRRRVVKVKKCMLDQGVDDALAEKLAGDMHTALFGPTEDRTLHYHTQVLRCIRYYRVVQRTGSRGIRESAV